jgi:hypothetical protein
VITREQIEFVLEDTVVYCAVLIGILVMSFGIGMLIGLVWSVLL